MFSAKNRRNNRYVSRPTSISSRTLGLVMLLAVVISVALYFTNGRDVEDLAGNDSPGVVQAAVMARLEPGIFQLLADRRENYEHTSAELQKGESLSVVLERVGLNQAEAYEVVQAVGELLDLTKVRPGIKATLYRAKQTGGATRLEFTKDQDPPLVVLKTPAGYVASWHNYEPVVNLEAAQGTIKTSLWDSAVNEYGLNPELVIAFAEIFAYDIDFFTDIKQGDTFRLVYESKYCQGARLGSGRILAAEFMNNGQRVEAFYYENSKGIGGYYDASGRSLKKMFLKSPLQYRRISSYFSRSRLHPILKIRRAHLGVDYSAASGTPVESLGDGKVIFKGWKGGYGNYLEIRHGQGYVTCYGHLQGFARGLKNGQRVQQGQLIAYVGSTGLSTGPHLDFRIRKDKEYIDPLSLKLEPAPPIDALERQKFSALVENYRAQLGTLLAARRS